jgi:hypothetical protein
MSESAERTKLETELRKFTEEEKGMSLLRQLGELLEERKAFFQQAVVQRENCRIELL